MLKWPYKEDSRILNTGNSIKFYRNSIDMGLVLFSNKCHGRKRGGSGGIAGV